MRQAYQSDVRHARRRRTWFMSRTVSVRLLAIRPEQILPAIPASADYCPTLSETSPIAPLRAWARPKLDQRLPIWANFSPSWQASAEIAPVSRNMDLIWTRTCLCLDKHDCMLAHDGQRRPFVDEHRLVLVEFGPAPGATFRQPFGTCSAKSVTFGNCRATAVIGPAPGPPPS